MKNKKVNVYTTNKNGSILIELFYDLSLSYRYFNKSDNNKKEHFYFNDFILNYLLMTATSKWKHSLYNPLFKDIFDSINNTIWNHKHSNELIKTALKVDKHREIDIWSILTCVAESLYMYSTDLIFCTHVMLYFAFSNVIFCTLKNMPDNASLLTNQIAENVFIMR